MCVTCQLPHLSWASHFDLSSLIDKRERDWRNQTKNWRWERIPQENQWRMKKPTPPPHAPPTRRRTPREWKVHKTEVTAATANNGSCWRSCCLRYPRKYLTNYILSPNYDYYLSLKLHSWQLDSLTDDDDEEEEFKEEEKVEKASSSEIIKELNNIKRQNTITHYLLTASILVTLAWQLSEISLIFKIRQGLNNPLKSIGGAIKGLFTSRSSQENDDNQDSSQIIPPTYLPGLKIPDLPNLDLPGFDTSNDDD